MPYALHGTTVVRADTGKPVPGGSHPGNKRKALAHLRALQINVMAREKAHTYKSYGRDADIQELIPVTTKVIRTGDTELGRHSEPAGSPLRLRAGSGKYLGIVGKRRSKIRKLRGLASFKNPPEISGVVVKTYNESQQRDDHGRWAAVGSALGKLGKVRLRPKVQALPGHLLHGLGALAGPAGRLAIRAVQHKRGGGNSLLGTIDEFSSRWAAQIRASKRVTTKAGYNPGEARDDHGRWATSGGFLSGFSKSGAAHVQRIVRELDRMKRKPPYTKLTARGSISVGGQPVRGYYNIRTGEIHVATNGAWPGLTASHEIGHSIDHKGLSEPWNSSSPAGKAWREAVNQTPEVKQLRKWQKQGYIEQNGNRYYVHPDFFKYFLSNRELWARSFSQWHAGRSHNLGLKVELRRSQQQQLPLQWRNENFGPVNREITRLMRKNGYL